MVQGFCIKKRLYVYQGDVENHCGIRATIFGATGYLGTYVSGYLGHFGSQMVLPFNEEFNSYAGGDNIRELKNAAKPGNVTLVNGLNLKNQTMIENLVANSNVVINLLGPRTFLRRHQTQKFEDINIEAAERIAEACKKKGVLRLIHFSAVGADENSLSTDFRTKAVAEKRVLDIFPDATIIRPCSIFGMNDYFASHIERQLYFFANRTIVTDDLTAKKQPIFCKDVAIAVMNALKMEESKGKIYELGGPHVLTMKEVYEIIINFMKVKPKLYYVNPDWIYYLTDRFYNWEFLSGELTTKKSLDLVVNESGSVGTIKDLYVQPVAFKDGIGEILRHSLPAFGQTE